MPRQFSFWLQVPCFCLGFLCPRTKQPTQTKSLPQLPSADLLQEQFLLQASHVLTLAQVPPADHAPRSVPREPAKVKAATKFPPESSKQ